MPFYANTPEARLGRADSLDPSTTCRGITGGGRPCRRALSADDEPPASSRLRPAKKRTDNLADESLYCWQHKDQASASAQSTPGPKLSHTSILEGRTSIDTLAERLGLVRTQSQKPQYGWGSGNPSGNSARPKSKTTFCCCFSLPSFDEVELPPRPKPYPVQPASTSHRPGGKKKSSGRRKASSLIPDDLPEETTAQLVAELEKTVSQQDEAGYIYIFWLTPESEPATPPAEAARSLLSPPSTSDRGRRPSDVLSTFARLAIGDDSDNDNGQGQQGSHHKTNKPKKKVLLKIGRATNVQRRLNEWQRQCGYNLSLIRYYPYVPSSSPGSSGGAPRKVPHSHKVERLVHIELTGRGLRVADREKCEACGREHREWFEVEASRSAVADVDEVVRRWSDWDEGLL
ncbi:meiotically up-regulated gene 113-domain-containing protein [Chaetomium tenue]|uniref:Meiotically up-regulated gene 113-domain-containing protein n=1 Tax=Chaetomium tenue TaxID=1854479 RepID=A0ACB7PIF0_9PEZI|nr:meiotically up-regulated gene 113-domain-containing protein [Chaetomium globosum]